MHKIAFQFGGLTIYWYGVFVALGFLAGLWTASRRALRDSIRAESIVDLGPWLILGTLVGARGLYVLSYWREDFSGRPFWQIFNIRGGGLVFYGGLIGASLTCVLYVRWKKLPLWKTADILAPSIALGHAFGRIGCLMNGCCYGRACELPWAIQFPYGHATYRNRVHPTEIYEAALDFVLYLFLAWLFRRKRFDGQIFALYLLCYAVLRAFVESFRGDYTTYYLGGHATPAQVLSIFIFMAGALLWWALSGRESKAENPKPR
ncbi:MAG TPA: prolipoprotein diacylglyceryl transferase [Candidatus Angelobacter sp.]|nr:prolipoprotein diacylglyceryl transferase [Candidatus Angelobacter sp.]